MSKESSVFIERDPDGMLIPSVPSLLGCHPRASSQDEPMVRIEEAIVPCLEVERSIA